jgi:hypothetical protein
MPDIFLHYSQGQYILGKFSKGFFLFAIPISSIMAKIVSSLNQWRTLHEILGGGGGEIFNMYAKGVSAI